MSDFALAHVRLLEKHDDHAVVGVLESNYRLHLLTDGPIIGDTGKRLHGVIRAVAWKIDDTNRGGAYIEPIFGRPRRIQGRLVAIDTENRRLAVSIQGCPINCDLPERFDPTDYDLNQLIAIELERGATFTKVDVPASV